jgi:O-acetyl-ADP-ribose deacetylase (regulator of RNase III)
VAEENGVESMAFCCISTGAFGFPQREAASTALETIEESLSTHDRIKKVVCNVFSDEDFAIHQKLIATDPATD